MPDWLPDEENALNTLLTTYVNYLTTNFAALGVTAAKKDAFLSIVSVYLAARAAKTAYEAQGAPVFQTYRDRLEAMTAEWRLLTGEITGLGTAAGPRHSLHAKWNLEDASAWAALLAITGHLPWGVVLAGAFTASLVELLPIPLDDNLGMTLVAGYVMKLLVNP